MNYTINKYEEKNYSLKITEKSNKENILLDSIIHLLPFSFKESNEIFFKAEKVSLLSDLIKNNYDQCVNLIGFISKQLKFLQDHHFTLIGFDIQDIIVIDEYIFFSCSHEYLFPINNNLVSFFIPFKKPYFSSPELLELVELPSSVSIKTYYYAIGLLVTYCLLGEYLLKGNDIKNDLEIDIVLKPIYLTKMYWFLKRCLKIHEKDRYLLFN